MSAHGSRGGIGDISFRNDADLSTCDSAEHLEDGLELWNSAQIDELTGRTLGSPKGFPVELQDA